MKATCKADDELHQLVDEVTDQFIAGRQVDLDALLRDHPQHARQLRMLLPAIGGMAQLSRETTRPVGPDELPTLGDFRLLREIGHGGMGVVYEAEQLSLGRRVALKVLPLAAMLDQRQQARFQNEALAAAGLQHPHIVPVLACGSERDVHYYAMQYVEGEPLNKILQELRAREDWNGQQAEITVPALSAQTEQLLGGSTTRRQDPEQSTEPRISHPSPLGPDASGKGRQVEIPAQLRARDGGRPDCRAVAELGVQVAEALDYAHEHGVIHRDVKPANLLLDEAGQVWITDFGLARVEADAALTMTGEVVGTLRYMSPEQATGKRGAVDQRTDVYSLGATLYELLTLEPLFAGCNRQELLPKIALEEPRPPRKLSAAVPVDLETIVLKAVAKNPTDRYTTAQEMADDLRRYLDHRPIRAQPPTLLQRVNKWSRRNQTVVTAAVILLLCTTCVIGVAAVAIEGKRVEANKNAQLAEEHRLQAIEQRDESYYQQYVTQMRQGRQDWEIGKTSRLLDTLAEHRPRPGRADHRDWEWYYLLSLSQASSRSLQVGDDHSIDVAVSPQGGHAVTSGAEIKLWELPAWKQIGTLRGHVGAVRNVCWSSDGSQIASSGHDGTVRIWDPFTKQQLRKVTPPPPVLSTRVAWSPEGPLIATAWKSTSIRTWNVATGEQGPILDLGVTVYSFAWSPDGARIAAVGNGGDIRIWQADTGELLNTLLVGGIDKFDVAWSPDGNLLAHATYGARQVHVWDVSSGTRVQVLEGHLAGVQALAWSPDGNRLASGGRDESVIVWDTKSWQRTHTFRGHAGWVGSVDWTPDGRTLMTGDANGELRIWNLDEPSNPRHISIADGVDKGGSGRHWSWNRHWSWSADPGKLLVLDRATGKLAKWDASLGDRVKTLAGNVGRVKHSAWSASGRGFATESIGEPSVDVWRIDEGRAVTHSATVHINEHDELAGVDPMCRYLLTKSDKEGATAVWEVATGREIFRIPSLHLRAAAWRPDGRNVALAEEWTLLSLWDVPSGQHHLSLSAGRWKAKISWSPDGRKLAAGGFQHLVTTWDAESGELELALRGHRSYVEGVAWSPNGRRIASNSHGEIKLWDASTGAEMLALDTDIRGQLLWSSDGQRLAGQSRDGETIIVFDASSGYRTADQLPPRDKTAKKFAQRPEYPVRWIGRAHFLLADNRVNEYRSLCRYLVSSAKDFEAVDATETLSAVCALAPHAIDDYRVPIALARKVSAANPNHAMLRVWLGALLYRDGHWEEAQALLAAEQPRLAELGLGDRAVTWCWLALTEYRLNNLDGAKKWLEALSDVEIENMEDNYPYSFERSIIRRLRDEARALIVPDH